MNGESKNEVATEAQPCPRVLQNVYAVALHRQVLIVFVSDIPVDKDGCHAVTEGRWNGQWSAYCVPVEGRDHEREKHAWTTKGVKVSERLARVVSGWQCEQFDNMGFPYRE